jgi:hypothetical protein
MEESSLFRHEADDCGNHHFWLKEEHVSGGTNWLGLIKAFFAVGVIAMVLRATNGIWAKPPAADMGFRVVRPSIWPQVFAVVAGVVLTVIALMFVGWQIYLLTRDGKKYWAFRVAKWSAKKLSVILAFGWSGVSHVGAKLSQGTVIAGQVSVKVSQVLVMVVSKAASRLVEVIKTSTAHKSQPMPKKPASHVQSSGVALINGEVIPKELTQLAMMLQDVKATGNKVRIDASRINEN